MKLTHKLFHRMTNRSCKLQGCSLIYTGMAKDVDVPVLSLTLGIMSYRCLHVGIACLHVCMYVLHVYMSVLHGWLYQ